MFRCLVLLSVLLCSAAPSVIAQVPARPTDPVFVRAQALVSDGNGAAGRALIDSVIAATPPMAPLYPQALFWRASLAASAADAESDYKHIVVDYPLAPQAADALLRLAQLELARGDRDGALGHLQRIPRDYPRSKSLARASYWTARVLFEKNDVPNACAANANAMAQADASQVELRNQIQYQGQRCPAAVAEASPPMSGVSANSPATSVTASTTPRSASANTPSVTSTVPTSVADAAKGEKPRAIDTTTRPATAPSTEPKTVVSPQRPKPPIEANDSKPIIVDPAKAPKAAAEKTVAKASTISSRGNGYSVQVAAYNHKADAEKLTSGLTKRGYAARVDGSVAPFRVRIGRYTPAQDAADALPSIKA